MFGRVVLQGSAMLATRTALAMRLLGTVVMTVRIAMTRASTPDADARRLVPADHVDVGPEVVQFRDLLLDLAQGVSPVYRPRLPPVRMHLGALADAAALLGDMIAPATLTVDLVTLVVAAVGA